MDEQTFGAYLSRLLRQCDLTGALLADKLGVDDAMIYRWLRNEATPKLDSLYHKELVRLLELGLEEANMLRAAQVFSLSQPRPKHTKVFNHSRAGVRAVPQLRQPAVTEDDSALPIPPHSVGHPRYNHCLWGRSAILEALIGLLEDLPAPPDFPENIIWLSFPGASNAFEDAPALYMALLQTLSRLVHQGWRIAHLWRLNRDTPCSLLLVQWVFQLFETGGYFPSYHLQAGMPLPPYELLVIPQIAAMEFFATANSTHMDAALLIRDPEQIELLRRSCAQSNAAGHLLVDCYLVGNQEAVWQTLADVEAQPGGRVCVKDGLSTLTEPPIWYQDPAFWTAGTLTDSELAAMLQQQQRRLMAFQAQVQFYAYRDICSKRAVERMVNTGECSSDLLAQGFATCKEAAQVQLQHTIHLLKTYKNYQLALVDEREETRIPTRLCWGVAGEQTVLLFPWRLDERKEIFEDALITEPAVAQGFQQHFVGLWERIRPENRDKHLVIEWLEDQLARLD